MEQNWEEETEEEIFGKWKTYLNIREKSGRIFFETGSYVVSLPSLWPSSISWAEGKKFKLDKVGAVCTIHDPKFVLDKGEYFNPKFEEIERDIEKLTEEDSVYVTATQFSHRSSNGKYVGYTILYKKGEEIPYSQIPEDDRIK